MGISPMLLSSLSTLAWSVSAASAWLSKPTFAPSTVPPPLQHKCGVEISKDFKDIQRLDALNGNTKWADARALELSQIDEYQCFEDKGHMNKVKAPEGCKQIHVHFVHNNWHDGRHKACLVATHRNSLLDRKSVMQRCCPSPAPTQLSRHHSGQSRNDTWMHSQLSA